MITLADFFPGGVVRFVPPPFDERYWATLVYPARCTPAKWGTECARGYASGNRGEPSAPGRAICGRIRLR